MAEGTQAVREVKQQQERQRREYQAERDKKARVKRERALAQTGRRLIADAANFARSLEVRSAVANLSQDQLISDQLRYLEGGESQTVITEEFSIGGRVRRITLRVADAYDDRRVPARLEQLKQFSATVDAIESTVNKASTDQIRKDEKRRL